MAAALALELEESEPMLFDVGPATTAPAPSLPPWFRAGKYRDALFSDPNYADGYPQLTEVGAAYEKTFAYFTALDAALIPGVCFVINSSTGKDSTLMTSLFISAMKRWREEGKTLRPSLIQVSDTHAEFPEMAFRMRAEVEAITRYGKEEGLPLRAMLVQPPAKARLLTELVGNGKPLPKQSSGASRNGYNSASWCMDCVKGNVLTKALKLARVEFPVFVQCLGVRNGESTRRSATIKRYSLEDLPAVSRLGDDLDRLGFCPIVHWTDTHLRNWMVEAQRNPEIECPWRPEGAAELIDIYTKAAGEKENPHECALVITKDGSVSNACTDLTGSRMGCWMCLLSKNNSLCNTALVDKRYVWLKNCHEFIYNNHERNRKRVLLRNESGFNAETLFPKSFTFEERYTMLVYVFRAELESGFTLLQEDDLAAIAVFWEKHGIYTVTIDEARTDARNWKDTGELVLTYQQHRDFAEVLTRELGEGIPAGAFFPGTEDIEPLNLAHLVGISAGGFGSPIVPTLLAYVLLDRRKSDRFVVMVTDVPSVIGTRTNTGLLSGLIGAAWECVNVRQPTAWEREVSDGRIFFYATSVRAEEAKVKAELKDGLVVNRALARFYENTRAASQGCPEDPLAECFQLGNDIPRLSQIDYEKLMILCGRLAFASDELSYCIQQKSHAAVRKATANPDKLEAPDGREFRSAFKKQIVQDLNLAEHVKVFKSYAMTLREIIQLMRQGKATPALVSKFCFIARMDPVDPQEAVRLWEEFLLRYKP